MTQRGPPDSPFAGGEYHGVLLFPSEYPFKPPGIKARVIFFQYGRAANGLPDAHSFRTIPA